LAASRTAIEGHWIAIIATLGTFDLLVAANGRCAGTRRALAFEAFFDATARIAAITLGYAVVVAALVGVKIAVPTHKDADTGFSGCATAIAGLNRLAVCGAAVAVGLIRVVTSFAWPK